MANVDGVLLETDVVTVTVGADIAAILSITGPVTAAAGETIAVVISAVDRFNNPTTLPDILLTSDDPQTTSVRLDVDTTSAQAVAIEDSAVDVGITQSSYVLYTIGAHVITAQDVDDASVFATLTVTVVGGPVTQLVLSGPAHAVANILTSFPASALDAGNNPVTMSAGFALTLQVWSRYSRATRAWPIMPVSVNFRGGRSSPAYQASIISLSGGITVSVQCGRCPSPA